MAGGSTDRTTTSRYLKLWTTEDIPSSLPKLARNMNVHTLDYLGCQTLVACQDSSCDQLTPSGWSHFSTSVHSRKYHTSAVTLRGLLLMGGSDSPFTTELVTMDGQSKEDFRLDSHWSTHCSIQVRLIPFWSYRLSS